MSLNTFVLDNALKVTVIDIVQLEDYTGDTMFSLENLTDSYISRIALKSVKLDGYVAIIGKQKLCEVMINANDKQIEMSYWFGMPPRSKAMLYVELLLPASWHGMQVVPNRKYEGEYEFEYAVTPQVVENE